jgi:hypothetical protein
VTVRGDGDAVCIPQARTDGADERSEFRRSCVSDRVGNIERRSAGVDYCLQDLAKEIDIGASGVLGGKLDVVAEAARVGNGLTGLTQGIAARDLELEAEMNIGGREKSVDAGTSCAVDGIPSNLDVLRNASGERGDSRAANFVGNATNGIEITRRGDGESGLDDVDAELFQLVGEAQLL